MVQTRALRSSVELCVTLPQSIDQSLLQFIDIIHFRVIDSLLHFLVNRSGLLGIIFIIINTIKNVTDYTDAVTNKRCRSSLQICNRRTKYSARNDDRLAEVSHWRLDRTWWSVDNADWGRQAVPRYWCSHWECTVAECWTVCRCHDQRVWDGRA